MQRCGFLISVMLMSSIWGYESVPLAKSGISVDIAWRVFYGG